MNTLFDTGATAEASVFSLAGLRRPALLALVAFLLVMKLPTFAHEPVDWDERVYLHLSEHMSWSLGSYTTRGSEFDELLPHRVYGAGIFYHPPLIPYLIKILSLVFPPLGAAKVLNLALSLLSFLLVYEIGRRLSGPLGALLSTGLWALCPLYNIESRLVHLDFPLTVFLLLGIWAFLLGRGPDGSPRLFRWSAVFFALAMLTKYTAPVWSLVPLALLAVDRGGGRSRRDLIAYLAILAAGLLWWARVAVLYGTPLPADFVGLRPGREFTTTYLQQIGRRRWYDIWIYFLAICPLFALYLGALASRGIALARGLAGTGAAQRLLVGLNAGVILAAAVASVANAYANGYWVPRHVMPVFPVIYITLGAILAAIFRRGDRALNIYLGGALFLTLFFMSASTFISMRATESLRTIPAGLFWTGLEGLFY